MVIRPRKCSGSAPNMGDAAAGTAMEVPFIMPTIALPEAKGLASATVTRWLVQPDSVLAKGQSLVELAGEDAVLVVDSPFAGVLRAIVAPIGTTLMPGARLAEVVTETGAGVAPVDTPPAAQPSSAPTAEPTPILMPEAGNSMEEGTVLKWLVKPGDVIALGQIICEIETDKATLEYESPAAGRLSRIVLGEGESIAVKQPIAYLADSDAAVDAYLAGQSTPPPSASAVASAVTSPQAGTIASPAASTTAAGRVIASPAARRLAQERDLDLATIGVGSGPGGRILSTDLAGARPTAAAPPSPASADGARKPMSKMRRAIAANLQKSKQTVPHFYVRMTIDADPMLAFYKMQKPLVGCTINDVIVAAVARTMMDFPAVRSRIDGNDLIEFPTANIGVAVGVPDGLVVPVILGVDRLTLSQLAAQTRKTVENARNGKPDNMGKGNFTISNLGMFGVEEFAAIINPPESAILAVSATRETVLVNNGAMRPGRVMTLTLSVDHRIVDGLLAAQFLAQLKDLLEHPETLAV